MKTIESLQIGYSWNKSPEIKDPTYNFDVKTLDSIQKKVDKFAGLEIGLNAYSDYNELSESLDTGIYTSHTRGEILNDKGFITLERLERNSSIYAALTNFKLSVVEPKLMVKAADSSYSAGYAKDIMEFILSEMQGNIRDVAFDLMSAILPGYALSEIVYEFKEYEGKTIKGLRAVKNKKPGLYGFYLDPYDNIRAVRSLIGADTPLPVNKFVIYSFMSKHGNPYGFPLFDVLYPLYRAINELIKFLIVGAGKWANPSLVIYVPDGKLSAEDQNAVKTFAKQITQSSVSSLPKSMEAKILEIASRSQNPIIEMLRFFISEVEKVLLLNDLTVSQSSGGGTRAETDSKIKAGKQPLIGYTRTNLESALNEQLVRRVLKQNLDPSDFPITKYPTLVFNDQEKETRASFVSMVSTLTQAGYLRNDSKTDRTFVRDGIEAPREDDIPDKEDTIDANTDNQSINSDVNNSDTEQRDKSIQDNKE